MSVNEVNKTTGDTNLIAGGTLYADAPIGAILAYGGMSAPAGWMICNGAAVSRTTYAALFAAIGTAFGAGDGSTTFNIPDLREATTKGAGETGQTVGNHVKTGGLAVGEFLDDRLQEHQHKTFTYATASAGNAYIQGNAGTGASDYTIYGDVNTLYAGRSGVTTEVKAVGVNYIIKVEQVALPADFEAALETKQNITDNTLETTSKTVPGAINEINASLTQKQLVIENPSGVTADPLSVCNYIKGITSDAQSFKGVSFTVLANSLNWYSGNIWGNGGHTWWGIVIERNSNVETQKVYKYYADDDLSTSAVAEL